jgi:Tfp pilus assembly protein PilN
VGLPALFLFCGLCLKVVRDRAATSERRDEVARIEKEMEGYRAQRRDLEAFFSDPATRLVTQRAAFLNGLIDARSFPWTQFFLDLEHRLPGGVRILTLSPSLSGDTVQARMHVGALSDKSKLEFLKALETAPEFSSIELVSETRPARGEDRDVVELDLTVNYRPGAAGRKVAATGGGQ